jgi:uncharacterized membrane protein HdeD (DUF308 family)
MSTESTAPSIPSIANVLPKSRGWLIAGGILSIFVGLCAIGTPQVFSAFLVQFLGAFCLVTGVMSFFVALFDSHAPHRFLNALLAIVRIAAGLVLFFFVLPGVLTLTLFLAAFFLVEGFFCTVTAFKMRGRSGWIWLLLNGLAAVALSIMIFNKWPSDSVWVIGLLFGINALFGGFSLLFLGLGTPKVSSAA